MAFPTIPTAGAGRLLSNVQADTSATRTFPSLSSLTKDSGDLLIAIIVAYEDSQTNAAFGSWGGGFTEFLDSSGSGIMAIGAAYKFSDGTETGTFSVTQAATITGHAAMFLLSIPGAHASTPPEGGSRASGTSSAANPAAFDPGGWAAEDTLWIAVAGSGETSTTGSYTGAASAPTNYSSYADTGISADVVGGCEGAVAFRQLNAASEDVGTFSVDTSNARNAAVVLAVRPAAFTAFSRSVDDAISITDAISSKAVGKALSEGPTITDAITQKAVTKALDDTAQITDAVSAAVGKAIADSASITDAIQVGSGTGHTVEINDSAQITDAISLALDKTLEDAASITDAVVKTAGKALADAGVLSDQVTPVYTPGPFTFSLKRLDLFPTGTQVSAYVATQVAPWVSQLQRVTTGRVTTEPGTPDHLPYPDVLRQGPPVPAVETQAMGNLEAVFEDLQAGQAYYFIAKRDDAWVSLLVVMLP